MYDLKDELCDQLLFGTACIKFAEEIYKTIESRSPDPKSFKEKLNFDNNSNVIQLQVIANLYAGQSVLELDNLLSNDRRIKRIEMLVSDQKAKDMLDHLRKIYIKKDLCKYRNTFIAHTSAKMTGSAAQGKLFSTYKASIRQDILHLYEEINTFWGEFIDVPFGNNYFLDKFMASLIDLTKMLP